MLDRLLPGISKLLAPGGAFYLVVVAENDPGDITRRLAADGLAGATVVRTKARNESLSVLRFTKAPG